MESGPFDGRFHIQICDFTLDRDYALFTVKESVFLY